MTPKGLATVTDSLGTMATTMMPSSGSDGFLMSNGNGTLITPGKAPQVVPQPG